MLNSRSTEICRRVSKVPFFVKPGKGQTVAWCNAFCEALVLFSVLISESLNT